MKVNHTSVFKTPLGWIGFSMTPRGVRQVISPQKRRGRVEDLVGIRDPLSSPYSGAAVKVIERHRLQAITQLMEYCEGRRRIFDLPLDFHQGSNFQRRVWRETMKIPYGETSTYLKIALRLGDRSLSRAVGMALGANPLPLIIPCHRVIGSDGSLGGYSGGITVKRNLLRLEGSL
ncbi:MAG TPA: methylated-DNA--[protein]-cysteine S-methyltransferase [Nitrospiria bacterium]|nr:methylated-DNA--[protein]-cysteine S-methyltransferase [Nitrospiria bacterium]